MPRFFQVFGVSTSREAIVEHAVAEQSIRQSLGSWMDPCEIGGMCLMSAIRKWSIRHSPPFLLYFKRLDRLLLVPIAIENPERTAGKCWLLVG